MIIMNEKLLTYIICIIMINDKLSNNCVFLFINGKKRIKTLNDKNKYFDE
jgi:hypothetical protein